MPRKLDQAIFEKLLCQVFASNIGRSRNKSAAIKALRSQDITMRELNDDLSVKIRAYRRTSISVTECIGERSNVFQQLVHRFSWDI